MSGRASRPNRWTAGVVVLVVAVVSASLSPLTPAAAGAVVDAPVHPVPGPIRPGYVGLAYPVPQTVVPGAHVNDVVATVFDASGEPAGILYLPAGTPVRVEPLRGHPDTVVVSGPEGTKAHAPRVAFWVMPEFVELKDMQVTIAGKTVPLGQSRITYHRGSSGLFNDPTTPDYDGTTYEVNRDFLACTRDTWGIGGQTFAVDPIEAGVHRRNKLLVEQGMQAVDWGVAVPINSRGIHVLHRDCDGKAVADYGYTHHTTQWLEALSRAVYLVAASPWAGEFRDKIDAYRYRIQQIATLETKPANWKFWVGEIEDEHGNGYTHRMFMMAAALGMASTLATRPSDARLWRARAAFIAREGVGAQRPDGVNPERGGFDVLYQMYGTWLLELYFGTLGGASSWRTTVERTIDRAVDWMTGRIDPATGQIIVRGTTRVCVETVWTKGAPLASVDPAETIRAFLLWGLVTKDRRVVDMAIKIDQGQKRYGNVCPKNTHTRPEQDAKDS